MLGLGVVVAAAYRLLVLTVSLISYVLNADSGRYADTPMLHLLTQHKISSKWTCYDKFPAELFRTGAG